MAAYSASGAKLFLFQALGAESVLAIRAAVAASVESSLLYGWMERSLEEANNAAVSEAEGSTPRLTFAGLL
ncbi:hypothetical protein OGAPHI_000800 [Ogataea philodendri]|uniref:Uncharacterized protein n=1 Tax=Ogataea philodendri TaxID=1378263 RepID=A0A9P8T9Z6_9ASCO|nr:uncharacterized protein OGAPHI_000800 [Ogataea philodendri]KAH3671089.1 hypothetical protein OGAPHI_000800 [Ogataea philodendri]